METAGALLIRAWVDEDRLKARLIRLADGETETIAVVAGQEAILAAVEQWLQAVTPR